jgi:AmmeMemoRadiSam system protein A
VEVDHGTLRAAASLDPQTLETTLLGQMKLRLPRLSTCACGEGPILAAIAAAKAMGATRGVVVSAANSGDVAVGEYDRVVGYGARVFTTGSGGTDTSVLDRVPDTASSGAAEFPVLSADDKKALLAHARKTLEWYLNCEMVPLSRGFSSAVQTPAGAFVTLKKHGELRGCIGHMSEDMPLCRTVSGMALMAGLEDRRFTPVTAEELPSLEVEISVLTPARPVPDASHIVVGRDGVTLSKSGRSAVFLPQVAPEQGWSRDTMLDHLCLKAGLPKDAWRQGASLATFQAIVFSESDF